MTEKPTTPTAAPPAPSGKAQIWQNIIAIGILLTIVVGLLKGYNVVITDAKAAGVETARIALDEARSTKKQLEDHIEDSRKQHNYMQQQAYNVQLDVRDLYRAQMYNARSARLEKPPEPPILTSDGGGN